MDSTANCSIYSLCSSICSSHFLLCKISNIHKSTENDIMNTCIPITWIIKIFHTSSISCFELKYFKAHLRPHLRILKFPMCFNFTTFHFTNLTASNCSRQYYHHLLGKETEAQTFDSSKVTHGSKAHVLKQSPKPQTLLGCLSGHFWPQFCVCDSQQLSQNIKNSETIISKIVDLRSIRVCHSLFKTNQTDEISPNETKQNKRSS